MNEQDHNELVYWAKGINSLQDYEELASQTAMYKGISTFKGAIYNALKMSGEAGEIADKMGKIYGKYGDNPDLTPEQVLDFKEETGDLLWHLTRFANDLGINLADVADTNIKKLKSRQERGVLMSGNGDKR